jgi:hypothetical protein
LQLEGEIAENVIKNIENAKKYLSELWYEDLQTIHRLTPHSVWRVFDLVCFCLNVLNA